MSLMIMSIGLVMVATLFPISTLRTLVANQQTNSTIASFSAAGMADVGPEMIHNPDDGLPKTTSLFLPEPPAAGSVATESTANGTRYDGRAFRGKNYMVDPLGWNTVGAAYQSVFGNNYAAGYTQSARYNAGFTTAISAGLLTTQPDNWKLIAEGQWVSSSTATSVVDVTLDNDVDLSSVPTNPTANVIYRAVIFDVDGTHSEVRPLTGSTVSVSPPSFNWAGALPTRFDGGNIGKVRVEVAVEIYTWMLSVRKRPSGPANVDVVVFFNRNFDPQHEIVWPARFVKYKLGTGAVTATSAGGGGPGADGVDDNGVNGVDDAGEIGFPYTNDEPNVRVPIDYSTPPAGAELPTLKRGGYVYDTKNGLWYRIRGIESETFTGAILVLEQSIKLNNTEDLNLSGTLLPGADTNGNGVLETFGGAILHPNIVNVFPLEIKEP